MKNKHKDGVMSRQGEQDASRCLSAKQDSPPLSEDDLPRALGRERQEETLPSEQKDTRPTRH